jgi:hypothetical protein
MYVCVCRGGMKTLNSCEYLLSIMCHRRQHTAAIITFIISTFMRVLLPHSIASLVVRQVRHMYACVVALMSNFLSVPTADKMPISLIHSKCALWKTLEIYTASK